MDLSTQRLMMGAAGSAAPTYVEDVFSTWLYTGNGSTQTITNGIDLSGKGGLVWIKYRSGSLSGIQHALYDTTRGANKTLQSNGTQAELTTTDTLTAFNSSGFTLGADITYGTVNYNSSQQYSSWTFRKAAKFFDVVTFTQPGAASGLLTVSHSLGSTPGCIIVKRTSSTSNWPTYHRSIPSDTVNLNLTSAASVGVAVCQNVSSASFDFNLTDFGGASGSTYVAYLFAHDAGGFGDSGNDSVVKCGSYTTNGSGVATVTLGWEPQWVLVKRTDASGIWILVDTMRGWTAAPSDNNYLETQSSAAETQGASVPGSVTSTGFSAFGVASASYIYIAIRRGPMKTPTDATKVFSANTYTGTSPTTQNITAGFPVDLIIGSVRNVSSAHDVVDRLRGRSYYLYTSQTSAETTSSATQDITQLDSQTGYTMGSSWNSNFNDTGQAAINWNFRRAPGFFDVVAYAGDSTAGRTLNHNLGAIPELAFFKSRSNAPSWHVYAGALGADKYLVLNSTNAVNTSTNIWNNTLPTSTVFTLGTDSANNLSGRTYITYIFATCPGVSKVGSYTGTGTTLQVNCGFTSGARFVLIKRTDSTGDWYVWDSARGIVAGNDPYLLLNSTAAEVTGTDYVDTYSAGFEISSTAPAAINANGGSFIFLAVA